MRNNGEVMIQYGPVFDNVPDITLQGGGGAGYQGEQNYGGGGAGYQGSAGGSGDMIDGASTWRFVKGLFVENFKHLDIGDPVIMKHKIEPKSWKEVAESLDAVDKNDVIAAYESGRKDELEAYYENAVWRKLRRIKEDVQIMEREMSTVRNNLGVPHEEDEDAWSWLRGMKRVMNFCLIMTTVNLGLVILAICLV